MMSVKMLKSIGAFKFVQHVTSFIFAIFSSRKKSTGGVASWFYWGSKDEEPVHSSSAPNMTSKIRATVTYTSDWRYVIADWM